MFSRSLLRKVPSFSHPTSCFLSSALLLVRFTSSSSWSPSSWSPLLSFSWSPPSRSFSSSSAPATSSSSALVLNWAEAPVMAAGATDAPIVILHGLLGSLVNWRTIVRTLGSRRRIYSLDLRNQGGSPHSPSMTLADMVSDVVRFLEDRKIPRCVLMGHSLGGRVAMLLALERPSLVEKLVVVDIAPVTGAFEETKSIVDTLSKLDISKAKTRVDVNDMLVESFPDNSLRNFLLQNILVEGDTVRWRVNLPAIVKNMPSFSRFEFEGKPNTGQVLFVKGEKSNYLVFERHEAAIRRYFPNAEFATIAKAGHWVHAENPDDFVEVVNAFVSPAGSSKSVK